MTAMRVIGMALIMMIYVFLIGVLGLFLVLLLGWQGSGSPLRNAFRETFDAAFSTGDALTFVWVPATVLAATQFCFLLPVLSRPLAPTRAGRSFKLSVCAAAIVAAFLFVGLTASVAELIYWVRTGKTDIGDVLSESGANDVLYAERWAWWPYVLASWILWMPLLWSFCRRVPPRRLHSRLIGWLLAGTIIEVLVVLPLDIMVRRKSQCYCNTGTFFALSLSILSLLWLAGPGVVLALTSKRRRMWFDTACVNCGYEKGPKPLARCPECGHDWIVPPR